MAEVEGIFRVGEKSEIQHPPGRTGRCGKFERNEDLFTNLAVFSWQERLRLPPE